MRPGSGFLQNIGRIFDTSKMHLHVRPPPPTLVILAAVRAKAVILLLLIHCFMYLPLCVGVLCLHGLCLVCIT